MIYRVWWFCACADVNILKSESGATDRGRYASIGFAIFLTAVMAFLSGSYCLYTVFHNARIAVGGGVLWALFVFNLDRLIVGTMRKGGVMMLFQAVPRLFLAVLLGVAISKPLELRLFAREIDAHILTQDREQSAIERAEASKSYGDIGLLRTESAQLKQQVADAEADEKARYQEFIGESEGRSGTLKYGKGPVALEKEEEYRQSLATLNRVRADATETTKANQDKIAALVTERDTKLAEVSKARQHADGFLGRLKALETMKRLDPAIYWIDLMVTLLFMMIEIAPVMAKLLMPSGPYEECLAIRRKRDVCVAEFDAQAMVDACNDSAQQRTEFMAKQMTQTLVTAANDPFIEKTRMNLTQEIGSQVAIWIRDEIRKITNSSEYKQARMAGMDGLRQKVRADARIAANVKLVTDRLIANMRSAYNTSKLHFIPSPTDTTNSGPPTAESRESKIEEQLSSTPPFNADPLHTDEIEPATPNHHYQEPQ